MSVSSLLKTGDFFGAKFVYEDIPNTLDPYDFDAFNTSHTKLYAVASNLETGKAEYLQCINCLLYTSRHKILTDGTEVARTESTKWKAR